MQVIPVTATKTKMLEAGNMMCDAAERMRISDDCSTYYVTKCNL